MKDQNETLGYDDCPATLRCPRSDKESDPRPLPYIPVVGENAAELDLLDAIIAECQR